jgi:hypothetical protein
MTRRGWLILTGIATAVLYVVLIVLDRKLTDTGGASIVGFELAWTEERAAEILAEWGSDGHDYARWSLWIDYPFMASYGAFLALAALATRDFAVESGRRALAAAGRFAPAAAIAAACFDAIENAFLLLVLGGHVSGAGPAIASTAASIKFLLLAFAIVYALWGLASRWRRRREAPVVGPIPKGAHDE